MNDLQPMGLSEWGDAQWRKFVGGLKEGDGWKQSQFTGTFGGTEIAVLGALAQGHLSSEALAAMYGYGALDMLDKWKKDVAAGIGDKALIPLGIFEQEFIEDNFAAVKGLLF